MEANTRMVLTILGGTGDLMFRKVLPALWALYEQEKISDTTAILGVARDSELTDAEYRQQARTALAEKGHDSTAVNEWCSRNVFYQPLPETDANSYKELKERIESLESDRESSGERLVYLAIPPAAFADSISMLAESEIVSATVGGKLVIEKPFGKDIESARELNQLLQQHFNERQIYRIDHFLGKDPVQNLLALRFANTLFEAVWNRQWVNHVQITVAEELGVEERGRYYDATGVARDMLQNHLLQMVSLIAMEPPVRFDAEYIRHEKLQVLAAMDPVQNSDIVFGQYTAGEVAGEQVVGYQEEDSVADNSQTATYLAARLTIDNWRWQGVPFYVRTGKRMPASETEVAIVLRRPPVCLFAEQETCNVHPDVLRLLLKPEEGISLHIDVKSPESHVALQQQELDFWYSEAGKPLPAAYETLIEDILIGDQTLFVRGDEAEAAWRICAPILGSQNPVEPYRSGSWGPEQAETLLLDDGRRWYSRGLSNDPGPVKAPVV